MFKVKERATGWIYTVYGVHKKIYSNDLYFLVFYNSKWAWILADDVRPFEEK
jgi:hypothetical protein